MCESTTETINRLQLVQPRTLRVRQPLSALIQFAATSRSMKAYIRDKALETVLPFNPHIYSPSVPYPWLWRSQDMSHQLVELSQFRMGYPSQSKARYQVMEECPMGRGWSLWVIHNWECRRSSSTFGNKQNRPFRSHLRALYSHRQFSTYDAGDSPRATGVLDGINLSLFLFLIFFF